MKRSLKTNCVMKSFSACFLSGLPSYYTDLEEWFTRFLLWLSWALTYSLSYSLPRIKDILSRLGKAKSSSSWDARYGFWCIYISEDVKMKSAFRCHLGTSYFTCMSFPLKGELSAFSHSRTVLHGLGEITQAHVLMLNDDIFEYQVRDLKSGCDELVTYKIMLSNLKATL